jgi:hypothetical protein
VRVEQDSDEMTVTSDISVLLVCRSTVRHWSRSLPNHVGHMFLVEVLMGTRLAEHYFFWLERNLCILAGEI